jgi:cysteine desulfurase
VIYLDNNATTRIDPQVLQAMADCWDAGPVNPASQHGGGQQARRILEDARLRILRGLGARTSGMLADRLVFTSGGTEANNLALLGLARPGQQVLISAVEHPSVMAAAGRLAQLNIDVRQIAVDAAGVVDLDALAGLLRRQPTSLVAVMAGNNETGVIQPIAAIARLVHAAGALFHCDAVQWVGKLPTEFAAWEADSLAVGCHKFHGPAGVGGLCLRAGLLPQPLLFGGFQEEGLRPGTVPLPLVVGFAAAMDLFDASVGPRLAAGRDRLEQGLLARVTDVRVNGAAAPRLPHTTNLAFLGADRQALLLAADAHGLCVSAGSACASGSSEPSPTLVAMGLSPDVIRSSLRLSVARDSTAADLDAAIEILCQVVARSRRV